METGAVAGCASCARSADASADLAARGLRVTALRTRVLDTLHHAERPLGAYEIFDRLKAKGEVSAPPAVYRVLDFLEAQGLVHKLPSLAAYRACTGSHTPQHRALLLVCTACGGVTEAEAPVSGLLAGIAGGEGFEVGATAIELRGRCAACHAPAA